MKYCSKNMWITYEKETFKIQLIFASIDQIFNDSYCIVFAIHNICCFRSSVGKLNFILIYVINILGRLSLRKELVIVCALFWFAFKYYFQNSSALFWICKYWLQRPSLLYLVLLVYFSFCLYFHWSNVYWMVVSDYIINCK